jgi:GT2 family glycosyltransferase
VSGCCLLVRLAALHDIGLLDEAFFLYGEDVDWCLRARRRGYRVMHEPRAVALHFAAASAAITCRRAYFLARNGILLARKHGRRHDQLRTIGLDLVLPLASLARRWIRHEPLAAAGWVARGVLDGLLNRPPRLDQLGLRSRPTD